MHFSSSRAAKQREARTGYRAPALLFFEFFILLPPPSTMPSSSSSAVAEAVQVTATLHETGFCIVHQVFAQGHVVNDRVNRARQNFIEYNLTEGSAPFAQHILGSAGSLANPSSFHHPAFRYIRGHCKKALTSVLTPWIVEQKMNRGYRLETLFDQLAVRTSYAGDTKWKRDLYSPTQPSEHLKSLSSGDIMLRGWVNCNPYVGNGYKDQTIALVPGSFRDYHTNDLPEVSEHLVEDYDRQHVIITIPPGSMIVMRHGLAYHETKVLKLDSAPGPDMR